MLQDIAQWLVTLAGLYVALGILFAVPFVLFGARRLDPDADGGTLGFRFLIFPGTVALWPLLARRWASGRGEPPEERSPHRNAAREARR